jgi:DnaJ family protein C protein 3
LSQVGRDTDQYDFQLKSLDSAIPHLKAARKAISSKAWQKAVDEATKALEVGPNSVELREIRVKGYEGAGDLEGLIGDLRFVRPSRGGIRRG